MKVSALLSVVYLATSPGYGLYEPCSSGGCNRNSLLPILLPLQPCLSNGPYLPANPSYNLQPLPNVAANYQLVGSRSLFPVNYLQQSSSLVNNPVQYLSSQVNNQLPLPYAAANYQLGSRGVIPVNYLQQSSSPVNYPRQWSFPMNYQLPLPNTAANYQLMGSRSLFAVNYPQQLGPPVDYPQQLSVPVNYPQALPGIRGILPVNYPLQYSNYPQPLLNTAVNYQLGSRSISPVNYQQQYQSPPVNYQQQNQNPLENYQQQYPLVNYLLQYPSSLVNYPQQYQSPPFNPLAQQPLLSSATPVTTSFRSLFDFVAPAPVPKSLFHYTPSSDKVAAAGRAVSFNLPPGEEPITVSPDAYRQKDPLEDPVQTFYPYYKNPYPTNYYNYYPSVSFPY